MLPPGAPGLKKVNQATERIDYPIDGASHILSRLDPQEQGSFFNSPSGRDITLQLYLYAPGLFDI